MLKAGLHPYLTEAGTDEAGRGCLAGPVVAAAVILPEGYCNPLLNDSKKLKAKVRELLRDDILEKALAYGIGEATCSEIDEINILHASFLAMHRAINQLTLSFQHILVDGNRFKTYNQVPHTCIIGGDGLYAPIAAASILAKTHRDQLMAEFARQYPQYGWEQNAGYPTRSHRKAIAEYGLSPLHRLTFRQVRPKDSELLSQKL